MTNLGDAEHGGVSQLTATRRAPAAVLTQRLLHNHGSLAGLICLSYLQAGGRVPRTYDRVSRAKNRLSNGAALEAANYIWATLTPQLTVHGASRHKTSQVSVSSRRCWVKRRLSFTQVLVS